MNDKIGNCNDFVADDYSTDCGVVLSLEESVEFQKKHPNKKVLIYDTTDKKLVDYFVSIGGQIINN